MSQSQEPAGTDAPRKIMADTMTTVELAAHRRRNGIVLLPVGCHEMHGTQIPVGCDTFEADAACRVLAPEWDAVVLPPIAFTFGGATGPWPGTVSLHPRETMDYVSAVVRAILRNGFKRVVLVSIHGPSSAYLAMVLRGVFEETGELPIQFYPRWEEFGRLVKEEFGDPHVCTSSVLAALYIMGRHGEFDPTSTGDETVERTRPLDSLTALGKHGVHAPYRYLRPEDHVGRRPGLTMDDAPRLAELFRQAILTNAAGLPEHYERYQRDMWQAIEEAPWDKI